jgi:hypothetical protein
MGMRSSHDARVAPMLRLAVAAVAAEAAGLCVAAVFNLVDWSSGQAWTTGNAVGLTVTEFIVAAGVACVAAGLYRAQPWSRTPAVIIQLFTLMIGIWLLQAHRYGWGLPALALAVAALAGLLAPASLRALNRQR